MAKKKSGFQFLPFSRKQKQLMNWYMDGSPYADCDMVIADGAIRSGKTVAMICGFFRWAISSFDHGNFILAGKTIGALKRNVISPALEILRAWGIEYKYISSGSEMRLEIENRTFYMYDASNERSQDRLQGLTAAGALADEVALFPKSFVEQMIGRCSVKGARMWLNCNPESPSHYVKTELIDKAEEKKIYHLHFLMDDNLSLAPETRARNERMFSGVFYKRFILGQWIQTEGLVYDMFNKDEHVIDTSTIDLTSGLWYIAIDYGTINPCAFGLWCLKNGTGYMVKEYYFNSREKHRQKTDEEYYEDLEDFAGNVPVEAVIIDPSAASFKATIRRHGKFRSKDGNNAVLDGIRLTSSLIASGHLFFDQSCESHIKEFGLYSWNDKATTGKDEVIKENDHSMDQMRYFVNTIMRHEVRMNGI